MTAEATRSTWTTYASFDDLLDEFYPEDAEGQSRARAGGRQLAVESQARRLADMRKRRGLTQQQVADRMHVRQERVSAIERGRVDLAELRTLMAYVEALGGRLEVIADFGTERYVLD